MTYLVTSFYTENTPYEKEVRALLDSVRKLRIDALIEAVPNLGSWEKNCQHKARFLLDMLDRFPRTNLVWVDADAVFLKRPVLFETLDCDLAYHQLEKDRELLSGTLFVRNCLGSRQLLADWVALNARNDEWDQRNLQTLLERRPSLNCYRLPAAYCKIFDSQEQVTDDPVVVHYQASRRFRNIINNPGQDDTGLSLAILDPDDMTSANRGIGTRGPVACPASSSRVGPG